MKPLNTVTRPVKNLVIRLLGFLFYIEIFRETKGSQIVQIGHRYFK